MRPRSVLYVSVPVFCRPPAIYPAKTDSKKISAEGRKYLRGMYLHGIAGETEDPDFMHTRGQRALFFLFFPTVVFCVAFAITIFPSIIAARKQKDVGEKCCNTHVKRIRLFVFFSIGLFWITRCRFYSPAVGVLRRRVMRGGWDKL
jgi:hypothetical protein